MFMFRFTPLRRKAGRRPPPCVVAFLPHTGHSFVQSPNVYRSSFLSPCHRDSLQEVSPGGCRYKLDDSHNRDVQVLKALLWLLCEAPTFASFWVVTEPVMSVSAAVAALSLHVPFAAALTGNEAGPHVCGSVTHAPEQRAHRVAVTGCRGRVSGVRTSLGWLLSSLAPHPGLLGSSHTSPPTGSHSPSQMLGALMSLSGCW